ncbi:extracellular solute-binding protein [Paraburkholderia sp. DHOC27]|uniref:extracellular solute-binding protein n=1 Tax=Paraburkholderia sp. DHOC27 TaxID=2303330 RepID=UPI000E3C43A6|nr:extracellular solute-binding protein [Paraburkholderia sp. DHOC27]RFU49264.1 extracellular solute-binding protein [Paraburkholderia sp. DHOC27]
MHTQDRLAALAVLDKVAGILRDELGEDAQAVWPVLGALLQNHLRDRPMTITALADLSGLPRTSARRVVFAMKAKGWLQFRAGLGSGNRDVVLPTASLLDRLDSITEQTVKMIVGASHEGAVDRFDARSLTRDAGIPWPRPAAEGFNEAVELTLVAYEDPVFDILKRNRTDVERFVGHRVRIMTFPQDTYRSALNKVLTETSRVEAAAPLLVAIPFPWLAEQCDDGHLLELQTLQAESSFSGADFYDAVWQAGWFDKQLYAIPLQPAVDFLWYRQDLFEAEGLEPPRSFDDVLRCATLLRRRSQDRAGITWSAAPGLPLAETFLQILGAQGGQTFDGGVLQVDTEIGREVIDYLRALVPLSPAQLRSVGWSRNAQIFGSGKAAMCYHWSNRYGMLDSHTLWQKGGRVGLQLHPTFAPGVTPVSPLGGALLAIPARNDEAAARRAWRAIETFASPELMKYFVLHGAAGSSRHSVAEDYYVLQRNRVIEVIDQLAKTRQIKTVPSPAIPAYHDLVQVLSDHLEVLLFDTTQDVRKGLGKLQRALSLAGRRRK